MLEFVTGYNLYNNENMQINVMMMDDFTYRKQICGEE